MAASSVLGQFGGVGGSIVSGLRELPLFLVPAFCNADSFSPTSAEWCLQSSGLDRISSDPCSLVILAWIPKEQRIVALASPLLHLFPTPTRSEPPLAMLNLDQVRPQTQSSLLRFQLAERFPRKSRYGPRMPTVRSTRIWRLCTRLSSLWIIWNEPTSAIRFEASRGCTTFGPSMRPDALRSRMKIHP